MYRKGENMRILILSCNTGGGHNAAGRAVKEIFEKNGDEAVMLDYLCLAGNKVSKTVGNVYIETVKNVPGLFGAVYKLGMGVSRICHRSPVYYVNSVMAKYIKQYLKENPADAVIMPHLYPAEAIQPARDSRDRGCGHEKSRHLRISAGILFPFGMGLRTCTSRRY